jgi:hypothetical protein
MVADGPCRPHHSCRAKAQTAPATRMMPKVETAWTMGSPNRAGPRPRRGDLAAAPRAWPRSGSSARRSGAPTQCHRARRRPRSRCVRRSPASVLRFSPGPWEAPAGRPLRQDQGPCGEATVLADGSRRPIWFEANLGRGAHLEPTMLRARGALLSTLGSWWRPAFWCWPTVGTRVWRRVLDGVPWSPSGALGQGTVRRTRYKRPSPPCGCPSSMPSVG